MLVMQSLSSAAAPTVDQLLSNQWGNYDPSAPTRPSRIDTAGTPSHKPSVIQSQLQGALSTRIPPRQASIWPWFHCSVASLLSPTKVQLRVFVPGTAPITSGVEGAATLCPSGCSTGGADQFFQFTERRRGRPPLVAGDCAPVLLPCRVSHACCVSAGRSAEPPVPARFVLRPTGLSQPLAAGQARFGLFPAGTIFDNCRCFCPSTPSADTGHLLAGPRVEQRCVQGLHRLGLRVSTNVDFE